MLSTEKYKKEDYPIVITIDEDFEIREKSISFNQMNLTVNSGIDKGMILKVIKVNHSVQFCKNIHFDNGFKIFVEVVKPVDKDYRKGMKYHLISMGAFNTVEDYLKTKYTIN